MWQEYRDERREEGLILKKYFMVFSFQKKKKENIKEEKKIAKNTSIYKWTYVFLLFLHFFI